ncbi:MAG: hypothetical protein ACLUOO_03095 [Coprococcus sp.]
MAANVLLFLKTMKFWNCKDIGDEYGLKEIWATGTILDGNSSGRFFRDYLTGRYETDGYGVLYKVYGIGDDRMITAISGPKRAELRGKYYQGVPVDQQESETVQRKKPIGGFYDPHQGISETVGARRWRGVPKWEKTRSLD